MIERTLIVVKPNGVRRGLVGTILSRFEGKGLRLVELKSHFFSEESARRFYAEHEGKNFFGELVSFITSGPVVAAILEGENCIQAVRRMIGETDPIKAAPGSIRGDYGLTITENVIHASADQTSFERESKVIFS